MVLWFFENLNEGTASRVIIIHYQIKMPKPYDWYCSAVVIFIILVAKTNGLIDDEVMNLSGVIGKYETQNNLMCQRLCWYRSPCIAFSFDR